jgi:6-phosphogluconate dehydrogenase
MRVGLVGLGRMGQGLRGRLEAHGHEVTGFDRDPAVSETPSLEALVAALPAPRVVWVMVPAGVPTDATIDALGALLSPGDTIIEGGNSYHRDSLRRAAAVAERGIGYVDAGVSGGIWGEERGFCIMAGGPREVVAAVEPLFEALAPPGGYAHVGPQGAGHYAKMVHNGIEYGLMQAYAEGFDLLQAAPEYGYDLGAVAALWGNGSVVRSWLLELTALALAADPRLESIRGWVDDSGHGRSTIDEAVARGVPATVLAHALFARFDSRQKDSFAMRLVAALRNQFGGHAVKPA